MADVLERLKAALADRYTIERELGSGGMATVYLAEDLKHHRKVAVKVLRPELAAALGPDRFHREIEIAANLHHPHILPLYDSGDADGFLYYVMPYEEGQSLRDKLAHEGELPIAEAVRILRDVVDALSDAHEHGVVHRDIKPDNVLLTKHHALVTDFGVAKALSEATSAQKLTTEGVALGTPAYMSPEQAAADKHIDHRADIYAVGVVAYELLTGRTPFLGTTPQMILSAHITDTPEPVTKYRESVPPALEQLVMRCLEKKAADRWQSAEELLPQLEALATPSGGVTPTGTMPVDWGARQRWRMAGAAAGVAAIVVIAVLVSPIMAPSPITITTSNITRVTHDHGIEYQPAISPDGKEVAYLAGPVTNARLVVRSTVDVGSGGESRPAPEEGGAHRHPAWTPDGASLRFFVFKVGSGGSWHEVGKLGGSVRTVSIPWPITNTYSNELSPDGTRVVASRGDSIFVYTADSGEPELLGVHAVESSSGLHSFVWSPDERLIAYAGGARLWAITLQVEDASSIWIIDADGGEPVRVTGEGSVDISPAWLDDDHLLFVSDRDGPREVYVVEVGPSGPRGAPRKVAGATGAHTISYSVLGRKLALSKATVSQNIWSYPIDSGTVSVADGHRVTTENAQIQAHDISADGRWIAYSSDLRGNLDIYKRPVESGNPRLVADSPNGEIDPRWSPDGTEIAFHKTVGGENAVMVVPSDGGTPVQLASAEWTWLPAWSPSGLDLAFNSNQTGQLETWVVSREAVGGPWSEATQLTDFGCEPSDWAPDGSGVLCTVGAGGRGFFLLKRILPLCWCRGKEKSCGATIPRPRGSYSQQSIRSSPGTGRPSMHGAGTKTAQRGFGPFQCRAANRALWLRTTTPKSLHRYGSPSAPTASI
jgi:serine/threonine-protein kinase